jgi:hypothetical protein
MRLKPCWSCDAEGPCYPDCLCAKCVDPDGYEEWRSENPDQYADWLESQRVDGDEWVDW